jgi:hypothetical protein
MPSYIDDFFSLLALYQRPNLQFVALARQVVDAPLGQCLRRQFGKGLANGTGMIKHAA